MKHPCRNTAQKELDVIWMFPHIGGAGYGAIEKTFLTT